MGEKEREVVFKAPRLFLAKVKKVGVENMAPEPGLLGTSQSSKTCFFYKQLMHELYTN